jgi:predicted DNA-binding transcriptional regulator YafY
MGRSKDERLASLAAYLAHSGRARTLDEIRQVFADYAPGEAGRQMFIRDKRLLAEAGFDVEEDGGRYRIDVRRLYLEDLFLEDAERAALLVSLSAVREGRAAVPSVGPTFGGFGDLQARSGFGAGSLDADLNVEGPVRLLHGAISERRRVRGRYSGKDRVLEPYGLVSRRGNWYLRALDVAAGEAKNFRVERYEDGPAVEGPAGAFERPSEVDLPGELGDGWQLPSEERFDVVVDVDEHLAGRAAFEVGDRGSFEWRTDGTFRITMEVTHVPAFRSWLLTYLDHAVVVGPPEVRAAIRSWLAEVAAS